MSVLKRILCPIDFDDHSGRALARAEDLARRHGAELRLLHVLPSRPDSILHLHVPHRPPPHLKGIPPFSRRDTRSLP